MENEAQDLGPWPAGSGSPSGWFQRPASSGSHVHEPKPGADWPGPSDLSTGWGCGGPLPTGHLILLRKDFRAEPPISLAEGSQSCTAV